MDGIVLWLMGPTSSGKTTISKKLCDRLRSYGYVTVTYDGDDVRNIFASNLGFASKDRLKVVKMLVYMANKAAKAGAIVIISALTANDDARKYIKESISNILIGYVECDISVCASRDPKGLYKQAKEGKIDTLIGYNTEYKAPENSDIVINSEVNTVSSNLDSIEKFLKMKSIIK